MIYMETGSVDPSYNLAFEETILTNRLKGDYLILWQNANTVVIGQNQNAEEEINREFIEKHGIKVVRRTTGGGAVYHDMGNLNYSFITDAGETSQLAMKRFMEPVAQALKEMGLNAEVSGRNDILVEGHKVSGTAQRLYKTRILHHGTLLFDSDSEIISEALCVDPGKYQSKSTKSVRSRVGNIRSFLPCDMSLQDFWQLLKEKLAGIDVQEDVLSEEEKKTVLKLKEDKYDAWEWTFGRSPQYALRNRVYLSGGILEVHVSVVEGRISQIDFLGDFMARTDVTPAVTALLGCQFDRDCIKEALKNVDIDSCFGTITAEEILEALFHTNV